MYDPDKPHNGERPALPGRASERLHSAFTRIANRLLGVTQLPDLHDRERTLQRGRLLEELDRLAERVVVLDEIANGVDAHAIDVELAGVSQEQVVAWRERFAWNIEGFIEHYRMSSSYSEDDVVELTELAALLLGWAKNPD